VRIKKGKSQKPEKDMSADLLEKMVTSYPLLQQDLRSIESLKNEWQSLYPYVSFKIHFIIRPNWIKAFYKGDEKQQTETVFHGNACKNDRSIFNRGLTIDVTKNAPIVQCYSYGDGIYCSPSLSKVAPHSEGSIYICLARNPQKT